MRGRAGLFIRISEDFHSQGEQKKGVGILRALT